jgi:hypothetical protein
MDIRIAPDGSVQAIGTTAARAPSVPPIPPPPAIANISPFGDLMGALRELSDASPEALRQVMAQMRDALRQAAPRATGIDAAAMTDLAHRFDVASQTGSLADLHVASMTGHGPDAATVSLLEPYVGAATAAARE